MSSVVRGSVIVRPSEARDVKAIAAIYSHHVLHGLASFEIEPPLAEEMARRRDAVLAGGYPYLLAERAGEVVGYAYASAYRTRPAYRHTAENSVYIRHDCIGQGIGRALLGELISACEGRGLRQLIAVIGDRDNRASVALHRAAGFVEIGTFRSIGYKFDRWVDTVLMQRALGAGDVLPPEA
ncbi:MAG TPA: GNAT family N-acetyltransferase [Stellaceae bacterium]|jgi:phosphinothricin acetyltransferase|nr:GNAT family N-acetyltransferase [Stellaceae bacterium]